MENPRNKSLLPQISYARVVGYDWVNHGVYVDLPSQQQVSTLAKVLISGTGDATRIEQLPLPIIGTWGLVVAALGDTTSLIWLGAFYMSSVNAVNGSSPPVLEDSEMKYMSHASGAYSLLDYKGNYYYRSPDGTQLLLNFDGNQPKTYRNIVDSETGQQKQLLFNDTDRNPTPPTAFYAAIDHPTGTSETITPSGIISKKTGPGGVYTPTAGPILELNPLSSGTVAPQGTPAGGAQLIGQAGNSDIFMDKDGNITIISNGTNTVIELTSSGDITINSSGDLSESAQGSIDISSGNDLALTSGGTITITAPGGTIIIDPTGIINITSLSGAFINMGVAGEIHLASPTGISLTGPAGSIVANGNVLG